MVAMRGLVFIIAGAAAFLTVAGSVAAPPSQWSNGRPLDQAVADLDPLATSMRTVQVGLRSSGEQSTLYQRVLPAGEPDYDRAAWVSTGLGRPQAVYYRVGPGFRARLSRINYLVRVGEKGLALNIAPRYDGEFIELIPNDTVFELNPRVNDYRALHAPGDSPGDAPGDAPGYGGISAAVSGLAPRVLPVSGRVEGQISGRVDGRAGK